MRIVLDIEADALDPKQVQRIHCIVCKDIDTNEVYVFDGRQVCEGFPLFAKKVSQVIGHNIIQYDLRVLNRITGVFFSDDIVIDTLILSRLFNVGRPGGHSLENWGKLLKFPKGSVKDFNTYTPEMLEYCKNDVELNSRVYDNLYNIYERNRSSFEAAFRLEMDIQRVCIDMSDNGFKFDYEGGKSIDQELEARISELDAKILECFPPEIKTTQLKTKIKEEIVYFNPGSSKQVIDKLWEAGWKPVNKTKGHKKNEDKTKKEKYKRYGWSLDETNLATLPENAPVGLKVLIERMLLAARRRTLKEWFDAYDHSTGRVHGKFNPLGARTHRCTHSDPNLGNVATKKSIKYNTKALRETAIDLGGRMRSLWTCDDDNWLDCINMEVSCQLIPTLLLQMNITSSGQSGNENKTPLIETLRKIEDCDPITASVLKTTIEWLQSKKISVTSVVKNENSVLITATRPVELDDCYVVNVILNLDGSKINGNSFSLISKSTKKSESWLCGTDMESAHLRIFAHMINDETFTQSLISGKKEDGTDPHSVNKRVLGPICPDRDRSKTFIFSYLNGAAAPKVSEIFNCSLKAAKDALSIFVRSYPGLDHLKRDVFPRDAARGYFIGIDGRKIVCDSEHLMMGMYLQSTESILMKYANLEWRKELDRLGINYRQVNWVHDEWVTEVSGGRDVAILVGEIQAKSILHVGELFKLRCPMGGEAKFGKTWLEVH